MNIGDYVRTPLGIGRITNIYTGRNKQEDSGFCIDIYRDKIYCGNNAMKKLKSSLNIIDLIEENDYVNGGKVIYVGYSMYKEIENELQGIGNKIILIGIYNEWGWDKKQLEEKDIKTIVTKEQFESMKYEVK